MNQSHPDKPTIGILGGGQLGRMLTLVAKRMGYRTVAWIGGLDSGPADIADIVIEDPFDSARGLAKFFEEADVATVEFENIPSELLDAVAESMPLMPAAGAIAICQNREREKNFLAENQFPCADFSVIDSAATLATALLGLPDNGGILKTAEFGYDGRGQISVTRESDAVMTWHEFDAPRAVLEEKIDLAAELSVLVVRDQLGNTACYDPAENFHRDHILDISIVPARLDPVILEEAQRLALRVAESLDYIGLLAVEFFLSVDGRLLVNEMAPRPHNSGHHTIEACDTSQFEQQLRVIAGLPLGSTRLKCPAVMLNLLSNVWDEKGKPPDWSPVLGLPGTSLHLYGKRKNRAGQKMGHVTFAANTLDETLGRQTECRKILGIPELS